MQGFDYIGLTFVDNSAATTAANPNKYACGDTEDKVFLLSHNDYFGRVCKATDWAKAMGVNCPTNDGGNYLTRSPHVSFGNCCRVVEYDGDSEYRGVDFGHSGVRPAMTITVE